MHTIEQHLHLQRHLFYGKKTQDTFMALDALLYHVHVLITKAISSNFLTRQVFEINVLPLFNLDDFLNSLIF